MDPAQYPQIALRVAHVFCAVAAGGAVVFQLLAVHPALQRQDEGTRAAVRGAIAQRWFGVVLTLIALLLVTGLINFVVYRVPELRGTPSAGLYHGLFGAKFLAALAFFHGAMVLALPGEKGDKYRARAGFWLRYLAVLLVLIVTLGAVLRSIAGGA